MRGLLRPAAPGPPPPQACAYLGGRQHFAQLVHLHPGVGDPQRVLGTLVHLLQAQRPGPLADVGGHGDNEDEDSRAESRVPRTQGACAISLPTGPIASQATPFAL